MSVSRIKSIIIGVLVIINLLLLAFIIADRTSELRTRSEELQRVVELYYKNGIVISSELKLSDTPAARSGPRSIQAEAELAKRLLGETSASDQGGSIYLYTSERGTALFRSGGEFEFELREDVYESECSEAAVKALMKKLGLTADTAVIKGDTAHAVQTFRGLPIFNCTLELTYSSGCLRQVFGRLAADIGNGSGGEGMSCVTALMRFLAFIRSGDAACTHVYAITPGYVLNTSVFGTVALEPAWQIITDAGEYQLSDINGIQVV